MILKLSNKENSYTFNVDDLNNGKKLYFKFQIPTLNVEDGKYNMVLLDNDVIIAEEQVCIGNFNTETIQYSRGENVYINSPLNANIEDVQTITIDVPNYTIYPSEGYDAMKKVVVDTQPVYDNGYNQGSTDGYDDGYEAGDIDGYDRGYDAGKVDGYDSGYTAGIDYASENAGEIAAANAIDFVATDLDIYYTKYSDNIVYPNQVTGIYPDGEKFYDYSTGKYYYNTGLQTTENTKIEIWFYNDGVDNFGFYYFRTSLMGHYSFALRINPYGRGFTASIGANNIDFTLEVGWHHIAMSFADGLVVDGEKIGDFSVNILNTQIIEIGENIGSVAPNLTIGMIKIDDNVIIPTADGLLNTITNQLLQTAGNGVTYYYINNTPPNILDNLIKSVNVQPKIKVAKYGIKFAYSTFTEIPSFYDFSNIIDMYSMFSNCGSLQTIPELDTSNVTNMYNMFNYCGSLQTIPELDTSNVTNMNSMFYNCNNLQTLPQLDVSKVTNIGGFFGGGNLSKLTEVGGWINLNINWNDNYGLVKCANLTYQSCINVLNGLADVTELGGRTLKVHSNFLTTVGDEISIGTNKGWSITA